MKVKILYWTAFNRWLANKEKYERTGKTHPALTPEWIYYRHQLWRVTALHSVQNQTKANWDYAIGCNEKTEHITADLFSGVPQVRALHSKAASQKWLEKALKGYDIAIVVRLDSDDMYHPDVTQEVYENALRIEPYLMWKYGYGRDIIKNRLYTYNTIRSGPFFAHRYTAQFLLDRGTMGEPHHHIIWRKQPYLLSPGKFIVSLHDKNLSSKTGMKNICDELQGERKTDVLNQYRIKI